MTNKPRPQLQPGETRAYPVLPLRDIVVFPHMIVPLFVGREKSIKALEEVMRSDTFILLATQKNASDDDPATDAIFETGTLASVLQLLKLPDGTVKVLVEGATRAKVLKYTDRNDYYEADASPVVDDMGDRVEAEAMARSVIAEFENYVKLNKKVSPEVVGRASVGLTTLRQALTSAPISTCAVGAISMFGTPFDPSARAQPSSSDSRKMCIRSGEKKTGNQPSAISPASATFFGPIAAR